MRRIGMGLVGPGFVGAHHIDAVRRLGFVDVVAVSASSDRSARAKADALGVPKAYGSYEALAADPDVHVVHNTTPNNLHVPVIMAALTHRKHVVSDKPLALNAEDARSLVNAAREAGVVHAVTFNYRGNPLVQQAREMIRDGAIGEPHFVHGAYLQDWLLQPTDFSWRLEPEKGGRSSAIGDIGSHWCDLVQHVVGRQIEAVLADLSTVVATRFKPSKNREAFCPCRRTGRGVPSAERGSGHRARALRGRRQGRSLRRAGVRRPQERSLVRGERPYAPRSAGCRNGRTSCGLAAATARTARCRRIHRCCTRARARMRTCRAGIRKPGPMPSAT